MDTPALAAAGAAVLAAPLVGILVAFAPEYLALGGVALVAGAVLFARPHWAVYLLSALFLYDAVGVSAGFAYFGLGDLSAIVVVPVWILHRLAYPRGIRLPR